MPWSSCLATLYNCSGAGLGGLCTAETIRRRLRDLGPRCGVVIQQGEGKIAALCVGELRQCAAQLFVLWTFVAEVHVCLAMGQEVSAVSLWRVVDVHEMRKWGSSIFEGFIVLCVCARVYRCGLPRIGVVDLYSSGFMTLGLSSQTWRLHFGLKT